MSKYSQGPVDYHELHEFSVKRQNDFWLLLWDYLDIMCSVRPQKVSSVIENMQT